MTAPTAAVDAAYKILDRHAITKHYHCTPGPDDCMAAVHERALVEKVAAAVLAADEPKPSFARAALQRAFR